MKALFALTFSTLLLGATSVPATAAAAPTRILVSVGELSPNKDLEWRKEACRAVYEAGNQIVSNGIDVSCRQDSIHVIDTYLQQLRANNVYHIRVLRGFKGSYRVSIYNWNRHLESDFTTLSWNIGREPHTSSTLRDEGLKAVIANFFSYLENETSLKTEWLLNARNHSNTISYDLKDLTFKSLKDRKKITVFAAARLFESENQENADYMRSRQEMALAYAASSPADLDFLNPEDNLLNILRKAALEGRKAALAWDRVISLDERGVSAVTLELMSKASAQTVDQKHAVPNALRPALAKKPLGQLIYLF